MRQRSFWSARAVLLVAAACGGDPEPETAAVADTSGAEEAAPASGGMQVSGLMGTIPERKILGTLEPRLPRFQSCFARGASEVEFIAGRMEFYFRVGLDGRVEWVYPRASSVGHRATELCLLEVAKSARFPGPKGGGAAEFAWGFEIDPPDGVRTPVAWDAAQIEPALEPQRPTLAACAPDGGHFEVTAYVAPGGQVLAAGASAPSSTAAGEIDCIVDAIKATAMPDPGSYPAKVTFAVP